MHGAGHSWCLATLSARTCWASSRVGAPHQAGKRRALRAASGVWPTPWGLATPHSAAIVSALIGTPRSASSRLLAVSSGKSREARHSRRNALEGIASISGSHWRRVLGERPVVVSIFGHARRPLASARKRWRKAWHGGKAARPARNLAQVARLCAAPAGESWRSRSAQGTRRGTGLKRALVRTVGGAKHARMVGVRVPETRPQADPKGAQAGGGWEARWRRPAAACERASRHGLARPLASSQATAFCNALPASLR